MSHLDIFKDYVLCTAEHCSLRSRKPKLYGDIKSRYPKITAAMEKLLYFWVDKSHKRATNSTGIRANWTNCLLYILKVLLNLHNFPLLNINCTEPYLGPLYISYIMVQILNCKIPERVLLNGAICKRFSKVSHRWRCAACHLLQVFTYKNGRICSLLKRYDHKQNTCIFVNWTWKQENPCVMFPTWPLLS